MNNIVFKAGIFIIGAAMKKPVVTGTENIEPGVPGIFISNHLGYFAPLKLFAFANFNYCPWVIADVTQRQLCKEYIKNDFVEPTLHWKYPLSDLTACVISPVCVSIMKHIQAIPVYRLSRRIAETVEQSILKLEQGENLLIFPESKDKPYNEYINMFLTGFVNVARIYYERNNQAVNFYPVCVSKRTNRIVFGKKITIDSAQPFYAEKQRIVKELEDSITAMLRSG